MCMRFQGNHHPLTNHYTLFRKVTHDAGRRIADHWVSGQYTSLWGKFQSSTPRYEESFRAVHFTLREVSGQYTSPWNGSCLRNSALSIDNMLPIYKSIFLPIIVYCFSALITIRRYNLLRIWADHDLMFRWIGNYTWYVFNTANHNDLALSFKPRRIQELLITELERLDMYDSRNKGHKLYNSNLNFRRRQYFMICLQNRTYFR